MLAEKAGIDPFEFRYRNIAREGDTNINSYPFRQYPMQKMMDIMRPHTKGQWLKPAGDS